jgi:hypothetical protein
VKIPRKIDAITTSASAAAADRKLFARALVREGAHATGDIPAG